MLFRSLVSVAVQVTVVGPLAKVLPLAGRQLTVRPVSQLSVAVGSRSEERRVGEVAGSGGALTLLQPDSTGASLSVTVTVNAQLPVLLLVSVAVQVTVVGPLGKRSEERRGGKAGRSVSQLSVAVGSGYVTTALHALAGSVVAL